MQGHGEELIDIRPWNNSINIIKCKNKLLPLGRTSRYHKNYQSELISSNNIWPEVFKVVRLLGGNRSLQRKFRKNTVKKNKIFLMKMKELTQNL